MIYLIITASITNMFSAANYEHRKRCYLDSIAKTLSFVPHTIIPIIVENNGSTETYLNALSAEILYTNSNVAVTTTQHKGNIELEDIKIVIAAYNIKDEDTIIKITGRYALLNDSFFTFVLQHPHHDAIVKGFNVCTKLYDINESVLGLFAIKCKFIKDYFYNNKQSPEREFAEHVKPLNVLRVETLGIRCCFADNLRVLDV